MTLTGAEVSKLITGLHRARPTGVAIPPLTAQHPWHDDVGRLPGPAAPGSHLRGPDCSALDVAAAACGAVAALEMRSVPARCG